MRFRLVDMAIVATAFLAGAGILSLGAAPADEDWKTEAKELFDFVDPRFQKSEP